MVEERPPRGLLCPDCGASLEPLDEQTDAPHEHRMRCPKCGERFRARRREAVADPSDPPPEPEVAPELPSVGPIELELRGIALEAIEWAYPVGVVLASAAVLAFGGFVPLMRAWLRDEINTRREMLEALGGVHVITETRDPDADLGPVLARTDAPLLFTAVNEVSRRLGIKPPVQIRITYLPCCGVIAWGHSRALILGLPLLRVVNQAELRAILAHELAHLARGDATRTARSARFVQGLRHAIDRSEATLRGPLAAWARLCCRVSTRLIRPLARSQETRADRSAASIAGGGTAASALVKVAMVQPLFREVLERYDPTDPDTPNLYAFFRTFWFRLPAELHSSMRLQVLAQSSRSSDPAHPPLPDRIAVLNAYPEPASTNPATDAMPATTLFGDIEVFEQMLHNRLFALPLVEPSLFHKSGT